MPGQEVIDAYHDLWNIEQSFRMPKHDLKARPIFHHQAEAIEARWSATCFVTVHKTCSTPIEAYS